MKKLLFNITFSIGFLVTFVVMVSLFSGTLASAFFSGSQLFPEDERLDLTACQKWTDDVRKFKVKDGEEANQVTVLMYHKIIADDAVNQSHYVEDGGLNETIVLKSEFKKQMALLNEQGYVALTAKEFQMFMENELDVPEKSVLITFDDGFKNNYQEAYPILKKYGFTALNFVITSKIDEHDVEYDPSGHQYFSVSDMENSCDVFDFQSHTYNLHKRTEDGKAFLVEKDEGTIRSDIKTSFVNLNKDQKVFSYPYGQYDKETLRAVGSMDLMMAFTVSYEDARPGINRFEIPRKTVFPNDDLEDFKKKLNLK